MSSSTRSPIGFAASLFAAGCSVVVGDPALVQSTSGHSGIGGYAGSLPTATATRGGDGAGGAFAGSPALSPNSTVVGGTIAAAGTGGNVGDAGGTIGAAGLGGALVGGVGSTAIPQSSPAGGGGMLGLGGAHQNDGGTAGTTARGGVNSSGGSTSAGGATSGGTASNTISAAGGPLSSGGLTGMALGGSTAVRTTSGGAGGTSAVASTTSPAGGNTAGGSSAGGNTAGGSTTGGNPAGGSPNRFRGGPCVVSSDQAAIEVFARGNDSSIYRRVVTADSTGSWGKLTDLDGTLLDNRTDLDCSANPATVHIVALGAQTVSFPAGSFLHAYGTGTSYNPFFRELAANTFDPSPSITLLASGRPNNWRIGATSLSVLYIGEVDNGTYSSLNTPLPGLPFKSSADLGYMPGSTNDKTLVAAFDTDGSLAIHRYVISSEPAAWMNPPAQLPAPTGRSYQYSPTICQGMGQASGAPGAFHVYVFAVAGDTLWSSYTSDSSLMASTDFSGWASVGNTASTAPDCAVTSDNVVHVVTLGSSGSVLLYEGSPFNGTPWTLKQDLGVF
jgi:hypothetical protein